MIFPNKNDKIFYLFLDINKEGKKTLRFLPSS